MATVKRYPFTLPGGAGPSGEVWTAGLEDGRPAVVLYGGSESGPPGIAATVAARLARAGFTAVTCAAPGKGRSTVDLAAVCDAAARGDLRPGLTPPARLVVLGYDGGVEAARAYAARHARVCLVTWQPTAGNRGGAGRVETEMIASGSHVVHRSLQLDEALDGLLARLARVM
jgi:hypothetical protein